MLTLISGGLGSGKTLFSVVIAHIMHQHKKRVVANFAIEGISEKFNVKTFLKAEYDNCVLILDEIYQYIDSRNSMSQLNRFFSYILFQSRKKSLEIYIIAQQTQSIDIRFRHLTDFEIKCQKRHFGFIYERIDTQTQENAFTLLRFEKAAQFFPLYNTNEIVFETSTKYISQEEMSEYCSTEATKFLEFIEYAKFTKGDLRIYAVEKGIERQYLSLIEDYAKKQRSEYNESAN